MTSELADRVEAATSPDRELDLDIWRIVDPGAAAIEAEGKIPLPWLHRYTASLDAAMSLAGTQHGYRLQHHPDLSKFYAEIWLDEEGETSAKGQSRINAACAYTCAALRARALDGAQL